LSIVLVQLMYVVYLAEDLHPHPRAYVGYFLRYLELFWTYLFNSFWSCLIFKFDEIAVQQTTGSWECGYYVMHWMKTIIRAAITDYWDDVWKCSHKLKLLLVSYDEP